MARRMFSLSPRMPYKSRANPISTAKAQGPSRSPIVLLTERPRSAKRLDHWLIACSLAPAQTIISKNTQKSLRENRARSGVRSCAASGGVIGTLAYKKAFRSGRMAHKNGR